MTKEQDCIFCKIIAKEIPAEIIYEDSQVLAIRDINPEAPTHILVMPKKHIRSMNEVTEEDGCIGGKILKTARMLAEKEGISQSGYRIVVNTEKDSGWGVEHMHFHLLGGKFLGGKLLAK